MAKREYEFQAFESDGALARWLEDHPGVTLVSVRARGWDTPANEWGPPLRDYTVVAWYYREAK